MDSPKEVDTTPTGILHQEEQGEKNGQSPGRAGGRTELRVGLQAGMRLVDLERGLLTG